MKIHRFSGGPVDTNGYLLLPEGSGNAVLIDAPEGSWKVIEPLLARGSHRLAELWITHGHWDHTQAGAEVVRRTGAKVRAHPADKAMIETPEVMKAFAGLEIHLEPIKVDFWAGQGDRLAAAGGVAEVRHVPGHCPGNILFYFADPGVAFVGDALFAGSVGRTDFPGGDFEVLQRSIRSQIYTLPDATVVYSGHGLQTTVLREKQTNPYVPAA